MLADKKNCIFFRKILPIYKLTTTETEDDNDIAKTPLY